MCESQVQALPSPETVSKMQVKANFVFGESKTFKNILSLLKLQQDEVTFLVKAEGLEFRLMDSRRISLLHVCMPRTAFEEYQCSQEGKICVNLESLLSAFKRINKDERVSVSVDGDKLNVGLKAVFDRAFSVPLLEPSDEEVPFPKLSYTNKLKFSVSGLSELYEDFDDDTHAKYTCNNDMVQIERLSDLVPLSVVLKRGHMHLLDLESQETAKAIYPTEYFKAFLKALKPLTEVANFSFSQDMPCEFNAMLLDAPVSVQYWVAPRMEDY